MEKADTGGPSTKTPEEMVSSMAERSELQKGHLFMEKGVTGGPSTTKTPEEMMSSMAERSGLQKGQRMFMDVTIPILQQLPAARLARFMDVDTEWRKTILSQTFEKEYLSLAERKPKILFVAISESKTDGETYYMFRSLLKKADESSSSSKLPLTLPQSVGATLRSHITYQISQSVRDMVCCYHKTTCLICNPSVGRYLALPHVDSDSVFFLGFDPDATTFKVLSLDKDGGSARVRVLTVSPEGNSNWRTLYSGVAHTAYGPGLYLAGTIYYTAHVRMFEQVLMCCDLQTEEFTCIHLPGQLDDGLILSQGQSVRLVNFHNKPGLVEGDGMAADLLTLWQLEDSNWCKHQFRLLLVSLKEMLTSLSGQVMLVNSSMPLATKTSLDIDSMSSILSTTITYVVLSPRYESKATLVDLKEKLNPLGTISKAQHSSRPGHPCEVVSSLSCCFLGL